MSARKKLPGGAPSPPKQIDWNTEDADEIIGLSNLAAMPADQEMLVIIFILWVGDALLELLLSFC